MNGDGRGAGESSSHSRLDAPSPSNLPPQRSATRRLFRFVGGFIVGLAALGLVARLACYRGWLVPAEIDGPSMAETYLGEHWRIQCPHCRFVYRCAVERTPVDDPLTCPNCGLSHPLAPHAELRGADRVWIDRWPTLTAPRSLPRGAVVALHHPDSPHELAIKRLVGFPGELMSIRAGDLWVGDAPWRKSWPEFTSQWIVVHDDRFRAARDDPAPNRWRPAALDQGWSTQSHGYQFSPPELSQAANDAAPRSRVVDRSETPRGIAKRSTTMHSKSVLSWLTFHPVAGIARPSSPTATAPIRDLDFHNPDTSRPLNVVTDLALCLRLRFASPTQFTVMLDNGRDTLRAETANGRVWRAGRCEGESWIDPVDFSLPREEVGRELELAVAQCDRQFFVVVDQCVLVHQRLPLETKPVAPSPHPLSLGAAGGVVAVRDLQVLRDIHYVAGHPKAGRGDSHSSWKLGQDEWFLLGDNPAVSIDSRTWPKAGVRASDLYGRVGLWTKRPTAP